MSDTAPLKERLIEDVVFCARTLNGLATAYHELSLHFWRDFRTGKPHDVNDVERVLAPKILLMHTELSELTEAVRKDLHDSHLPQRKGEEVELADLLLRVFDYAAARRLDLSGALVEKMKYNLARADHTDAARAQPHGKKF
jgi:NTP pyrophosphatase (non-canonical NTP hydrolase)